MPTYEFICNECKYEFDIKASISEYSMGLKPICPQCDSNQTVRTFTKVGISSSSPGGNPPPLCGCGSSSGMGCCG